MNKSFTKEDIIKKHETNVKSAFSGFTLGGILGLIYIVRYFFTGNFNFYFSLSVPEMLLKLSHSGDFSKVTAYVIIGCFISAYVLFAVLTLKNTKWLKACLGLYAFDFICLIYYIAAIMAPNIDSSVFIEVIIHGFIILFLSVGVYSDKKLKTLK